MAGKGRKKARSSRWIKNRPMNKVRRLRRRIKNHPNDKCAAEAFKRWKVDGVPDKRGGGRTHVMIKD